MYMNANPDSVSLNIKPPSQKAALRYKHNTDTLNTIPNLHG